MEKVTRETYHEYLEKRLDILTEYAGASIGTDRILEATKHIDWVMRELYHLDEGPCRAVLEEISAPVPKEEQLEDFSVKELIQELEKREVLKIRKTEEEHLYTVIGNFYDD